MKKILIITGVIILLFAGTGVGVYLYIANSDTDETVDENQDGNDDVENQQASQNIIDSLRVDGNHQMFLNALEKTELDQALALNTVMYTIFAPNDTAFESNSQIASWIEDENKIEDLKEIINYHMVEGSVIERDDLVSIGGLETVMGESITVSESGGVINLNADTEVLSTNQNPSNGIIYSINKILTPPKNFEQEGNIIEILSTDEDYEIFYEGVESLELVDELSVDSRFTLFLPRDEVFDQFSEAELTDLFSEEGEDDLLLLITSHYISTELTTDLMVDGQVIRMKSGVDVIVEKDTDGYKLLMEGDEDEGDKIINIVISDIKVENGVIHLIDELIL